MSVPRPRMTESPTIALAMVVCEDTSPIASSLASVRALVGSWVVVDATSGEASDRAAGDALAGIPGAVHQRPWRGIGAAATEAIDLLRGKADYALLMNGDDVLDTAKGFVVPALDAPL